jgi:trehalose/maltose hydrolase-like predicted phosphorylase
MQTMEHATRNTQHAWFIRETEFDPERLHHQETVFTIGNGYLGTRGAFEESYPGARPATLIHGIFDDVPIVHTELANAPDWLPFVLLVNGERFGMDRGEVLDYERTLDMRHGVLTRQVRWRSPAGHTVDIHIERFASLADPHVLAIRYQVTPLDFDGRIEFRAGINGQVDNNGYVHWDWVDQGDEYGLVWLRSRTRRSSIELGQAAILVVSGSADVTEWVMDCQNCPTMVAVCQARQGRTITAEKLVTIYSSRETKDVCQAAVDKLDALVDNHLGYEQALAAHKAAWAEVWAASDVIIEGDDTAQKAVRYNLFQLLIAAPRHDDRVSIPGRTLSGFGYRGHVFWDTDVFMLPFFTFTQPQLARNLLLYRYHTLPAARRKAGANGYEGAQVAWESAATGDETTPRWVPGPAGELVRIWTGDIQLHIGADVAYAVWQYWQVTGGDEFMRDYGAEIILDTAVFWGSRAEYNAEQDRYEINDVIGPDENHVHVNNNVFTNRMVQWHLETALETLAWLRHEHPEKAAELEDRLGLSPERLAHWADIIGCLRILHDPETGLIEQFEGFFELEDIDWRALEPRRRSIQSLLGIERTNQVQALKQADVLMLLYLLGDQYNLETKQVNWDYYAPRTDHTYGSSLSPAIHAILACELGMSEVAYEHFMRAALVDLEDVRGNASEGIHGASAGGVWQALVFGFAGLRLTAEGYTLNPRLPASWRRLTFSFQHHGLEVHVDLPDDILIERGGDGRENKTLA